jgi:hypothetical protein
VFILKIGAFGSKKSKIEDLPNADCGPGAIRTRDHQLSFPHLAFPSSAKADCRLDHIFTVSGAVRMASEGSIIY